MKARVCVLITTLLLVAVLSATAQAPVPVVERINDHRGRITRVTLFSNHVVIVSIRSDTEDFIHQATLNFDEHMVYLQALEKCAHEIGHEPITSDVESRDSSTRLILHIGPDAPRILVYSPLASLNLPAARIASIMDDIENRAMASLPGEFEIKQWEPALGERVELRQGGEAYVTEIGDDGTIVLSQIDGPVSYTVAKDNRVDVVLRVVEPTP
jgi:hypothetical protein